MVKYIEYKVLAVLALIFTCYHAVLTSLIFATESQIGLSYIYVYMVEILAFVPLGLTLLFVIYVSRTKANLLSSVSFRVILAHTGIALVFFTTHAFWQTWINSIFFEFSYSLEEVRNDFMGFLVMRFFAYITLIGLVGGIEKLKEFRENENKESKLRLELQKAKMKEMELKLKPEIIYPNLLYIKDKAGNEPEAASQMIILMAGLLRKLVDNLETDRIYISDDIKYYKSYISMISLRLEKPITTNFKLKGVNESDQVLSMILVIPLIEQFFFGPYSQYFEQVNLVQYLAKRDNENIPIIELQFSGIPDIKGLEEYLEEDALVKTINQTLGELTEERLEFSIYAEDKSLRIQLRGFVVQRKEVEYV